jgi:hypothetical protein
MDLGHALHRRFQVEIACMDKAERSLGHGGLEIACLEKELMQV